MHRFWKGRQFLLLMGVAIAGRCLLSFFGWLWCNGRRADYS